MHALLDRMRVNPKIDPEVFELFELLVGAEDERFAPHEATTAKRPPPLPEPRGRRGGDDA